MTTSTYRAGVYDAATAAGLLHAFHAEFGDDCAGEATDARRLARLLGVPATVVLVADVDGVPEGVAVAFLRDTTWSDGRVAVLEELYVAPRRRGQGVGTALMAALDAELAAQEATDIEIPVDEGDTDTRRFYERLGFVNVHDGERMLYYTRLSTGE